MFIHCNGSLYRIHLLADSGQSLANSTPLTVLTYIADFLTKKQVEKLPEMVTEFDEALWGSLVDYVTVNAKDDIIFTLTSGMEIKA